PNDAQLQAILFPSRTLVVAPAQGGHLGTGLGQGKGGVVSPARGSLDQSILGPLSISTHLSVVVGNSFPSWTTPWYRRPRRFRDRTHNTPTRGLSARRRQTQTCSA